MSEMATHPTPLRASPHHDYKSWTCTWYDDRKQRRTKRFGRVDEIGRREANARYQRWLSDEWSQKRHVQNPDDPTAYLVSHLCESYREHCKTAYTKNGKPTTHRWQYNSAIDSFKESMGDRPADNIEAPDVVRWRDAEIQTNHKGGDGVLSMSTVNGRIRIIKQMFAWARLYGLVQKATAYDVSLVPALRLGRSKARAPKKIDPVPDEVLQATLKQATPTVAAMIKLQEMKGLRSGELCQMRVCDLTKDGDLLIYRPLEHKTQHHGKDRVIVFGPAAQEIIRPFIDRRTKLSEYLFLPSEAHRELLEQRGMPLVMAYQLSRSTFKPGRSYTTQTYYGQVARTCDRAFDPKGMRRLAGDYSHRWHPHQLRHNAATRLRKEFGIEASSDMLGHHSLDVTEIYAERSLDRQKEIARKVG